MVDGAVLLVDAVEGPLAQTKFVLAKALARGLAPVVVLNKVDRPESSQSRCDAVASQLFDLFASLGADDRQLDFPVLYASAKQVCVCVCAEPTQVVELLLSQSLSALKWHSHCRRLDCCSSCCVVAVSKQITTNNATGAATFKFIRR